MLLHPLSIPALPFGLWYDDGERDHVIYRSGLTGYHRDHVVLHEICHLLARHGSPEQASPAPDTAGKSVVSALIEHAMRNRHVDAQEELAEMFASKVLKLARQPEPGSVSYVEQRAAAMFGIAG